ncbi:SusC/RagA family TonB-linked outer membrane protein [Marinifilum sp. RC60d5]|uniref:SusC/RagA family TonB-linked outer membrane protein n=1 Tax=Marinifilum sp. RC60d5 TaxID=3458414 RepID=UPI004034FC00
MKKKSNPSFFLRKKLGLPIKFLALVCLIITLNLNSWATVSMQGNQIEIKESNINLEDLIWKIKEKSGYKFIYNTKHLKSYTDLNINKKGTVDEILKSILDDTNLTYEIKNGAYVLKLKVAKPKPIKEQKATIVRGKVSDKDGQPLPGATVMLKGYSFGCITNENGFFEFESLVRKGKLQISFIGYKTYTVEFDGGSFLDVQLIEDEENLKEVVVTGYFNKKKETYTGNAKTFSGESIRAISTGNVLSSLSNLDPTFQIIEDNEMGSDPNTLPEFVIQGQSSLEGDFKHSPNMPTFILDGFEVTAQQVFDLDPNRVKSMTILKDAAATAIYGSRAANGVVVVETLEPEKGKLRLTYTGAMDFEVVDLSGYDLLNASEKLEYESLSGLYEDMRVVANSWDNQQLYNDRLKLVSEGVDTDWKAIPLHDIGLSHKHSLYAEGGDDTFRYGWDLNYKDQNGVMKGSSNTNIGTSIKLQYRYKNLNVMNHLQYSNVKAENSPYGNYSTYTQLNPYFYPYGENGLPKEVLYENSTSAQKHFLILNPLYNIGLATKDESEYSALTDNFSVDWLIADGLRLKGTASISQQKSESNIFKPASHTDFYSTELKGSYSKNSSENVTLDGSLLLSYLKQFKKHSINFGAVYNIRETREDSYGVFAYGFPNDKMDHIGMALQYAEGDRPSGDESVSRLVGIAGNLNYSYDDRYVFDASVRSDGSSVYGEDKRWGTFGSLGLGWNIHNEKFLHDSNLIQELRLRASVGITGSTAFSPYQSMTMLSYNNYLMQGRTYRDQLGALLMAYGNTNLKWQETTKNNIGVDFTLLNSKLSGSINLYNNRTKGVLTDVLLAPSVGSSSYKDNLGDIENKGFELSLRGTVVRDRFNQIQLDVFGMVSRNVNKLKKINNSLVAYNDTQDENTNDEDNNLRKRPVVRYMLDESINTIWANESLGIDPRTGEEVFLDMNGEKVNEWSTSNYKPLGNKDPEFFGNLGTMFMYKKWQLNANFTYSMGGDIYNNTLVDKVENVTSLQNADIRVLYDRWKEPGDIAKYKAITNEQPTMPTSRFIEEENYIELKSLNLSYTLQGNTLNKYPIERIRLSAFANNIHRWSSVKVERGTSYPFARSFSFQVQLTF